MKLLDEAAVSFQFVLTKSDKIGAAGLSAASAALAGLAAKRPAALPFVHATSSETGLGLPELRAEIAALVGYRI
jgi:GTP-binding protein